MVAYAKHIGCGLIQDGADVGGSYSESLQLGRRAETEGDCCGFRV